MSTQDAKTKQATVASATEYSDFNTLLTKEFKAKSEQTIAAVEGAVKRWLSKRWLIRSRCQTMLIKVLLPLLQRLIASYQIRLT